MCHPGMALRSLLSSSSTPGEVVRHLLGVADYVALSTYFHYFLGLGLARERSESAFAVKKMTHVQTQNMHPTVVFFSENDTSIR